MIAEIDGRFVLPDGVGTPVSDGLDMHGSGLGGITVEGPLSYFGGGTQDVLKLSSQGAGSGAVVLAIDKTLSEYRPLNFRGETITFQIKTTGSASFPAGEFNANGDLTLFHNLDAAIRPSVVNLSTHDGYYIGSVHGHRFNNSNDAANLVIFEDDGRVRIPALAGVGKRALSVDENGRLCV